MHIYNSSVIFEVMDILEVVADGTRFAILAALKKGALCACKLPGITGKSQPNISKHLRVLYDCGLVEVRREGVKRIYSLTFRGRRVLSDVSKW